MFKCIGVPSGTIGPGPLPSFDTLPWAWGRAGVPSPSLAPSSGGGCRALHLGFGPGGGGAGGWCDGNRFGRGLVQVEQSGSYAYTGGGGGASGGSGQRQRWRRAPAGTDYESWRWRRWRREPQPPAPAAAGGAGAQGAIYIFGPSGLLSPIPHWVWPNRGLLGTGELAVPPWSIRSVSIPSGGLGLGARQSGSWSGYTGFLNATLSDFPGSAPSDVPGILSVSAGTFIADLVADGWIVVIPGVFAEDGWAIQVSHQSASTPT